jgi:hypothetical protein
MLKNRVKNMAGWLQRFLGAAVAAKKPRNSLAKRPRSASMPTVGTGRPKGASAKGLPSATIIYGIGAGLLFVDALHLLIQGILFSAFMVFVIGGCLTGFALHHLKHQD